MLKLFLKAFLLLLATIIASFFLQQEIISRMVAENQRNFRYDFRDRFVPVFYFVERELKGVEESQWIAVFETHRNGFVLPANLRTFDSMHKHLADMPMLQKRLDEGKVVSADEGPLKLLMMKRLLGSSHVLVMEFPIAPSLASKARTVNWAMEIIFVALFIWAAVMFFWRDMMKLNQAAEKVGQGNFSFHIDVSKRAALRPLADTFNTMKDRIGGLLSSHRNLTNAISHEFRTPITRLRFRHQLAVDATSLQEKDMQLQLMNSAIDQLDDLSTELLEYARLDRETPNLDKSSIDTVSWLNELADEARELAAAEGRELTIMAQSMAESADGDYRYLSRAAANLLRNAVRYAKHKVEIRFERLVGPSVEGVGTTQWALHVDDDGPGIPVPEREHLFEAFSRLDKSRDRQSGGFGLGLAIVRQIARWHGGTAEISDSALGGTRVSVKW